MQPQPSTGGRPPADENGRKMTPAVFWSQDQPKLYTLLLGARCGASASTPSPGIQTVRKGGLTTGQTLTSPMAPWGWLEAERRLGGVASRKDQVPPLPPLGGVGGQPCSRPSSADRDGSVGAAPLHGPRLLQPWDQPAAGLEEGSACASRVDGLGWGQQGRCEPVSRLGVQWGLLDALLPLLRGAGLSSGACQPSVL